MESEPQPRATDVDRRIWGEELDAFVPERIFDIPTPRLPLAVQRRERLSGPLTTCWETGFRSPIGSGSISCDAVLMPAGGCLGWRSAFPFPIATSGGEPIRCRRARQGPGLGRSALVHAAGRRRLRAAAPRSEADRLETVPLLCGRRRSGRLPDWRHAARLANGAGRAARADRHAPPGTAGCNRRSAEHRGPRAARGPASPREVDSRPLRAELFSLADRARRRSAAGTSQRLVRHLVGLRVGCDRGALGGSGPRSGDVWQRRPAGRRSPRQVHRLRIRLGVPLPRQPVSRPVSLQRADDLHPLRAVAGDTPSAAARPARQVENYLLQPRSG